MRVLVSLALVVATAQAFSAPARQSSTTTAPSNTALCAVNRRQVVIGGIAACLVSIAGTLPAAFAADDVLPNGVSYKVGKTGNGPQPDKGELAAIRFKATTEDGKVIDDIFETPEPYYTRVGVGGMLPGVEGALPYMKVGDRWTLSIPVSIQKQKCDSERMLVVSLTRSHSYFHCGFMLYHFFTARVGVWSKGKTGIGRQTKNSR